MFDVFDNKEIAATPNQDGIVYTPQSRRALRLPRLHPRVLSTIQHNHGRLDDNRHNTMTPSHDYTRYVAINPIQSQLGPPKANHEFEDELEFGGGGCDNNCHRTLPFFTIPGRLNPTRFLFLCLHCFQPN